MEARAKYVIMWRRVKSPPSSWSSAPEARSSSRDAFCVLEGWFSADVFVCITVFEEKIQRNSLLHLLSTQQRFLVPLCSFTSDPALPSHSLPTPPLPPHLLLRHSWKLEQRQKTVTKCKFSRILPQIFRRCFADKNKLNLHDGHFKQWWFFLRWIARLHITFLWPWKGNLRGIGNWRLRFMNEIGKNNLLFCIYFRSLFQPEMDLKWVISEEERTRHDALFYSQKPKDQYLSGEKMCDVWKRWRLRSRSSVQIFLHIFCYIFQVNRLVLCSYDPNYLYRSSVRSGWFKNIISECIW